MAVRKSMEARHLAQVAVFSCFSRVRDKQQLDLAQSCFNPKQVTHMPSYARTQQHANTSGHTQTRWMLHSRHDHVHTLSCSSAHLYILYALISSCRRRHTFFVDRLSLGPPRFGRDFQVLAATCFAHPRGERSRKTGPCETRVDSIVCARSGNSSVTPWSVPNLVDGFVASTIATVSTCLTSCCQPTPKCDVECCSWLRR